MLVNGESVAFLHFWSTEIGFSISPVGEIRLQVAESDTQGPSKAPPVAVD